MGTVAERQTKGRDTVWTASRPLAYVCTRELSQGAVLAFSAAGVRLPRQRSCSYQP